MPVFNWKPCSSFTREQNAFWGWLCLIQEFSMQCFLAEFNTEPSKIWGTLQLSYPFYRYRMQPSEKITGFMRCLSFSDPILELFSQDNSHHLQPPPMLAECIATKNSSPLAFCIPSCHLSHPKRIPTGPPYDRLALILGWRQTTGWVKGAQGRID